MAAPGQGARPLCSAEFRGLVPSRSRRRSSPTGLHRVGHPERRCWQQWMITTVDRSRKRRQASSRERDCLVASGESLRCWGASPSGCPAQLAGPPCPSCSIGGRGLTVIPTGFTSCWVSRRRFACWCRWAAIWQRRGLSLRPLQPFLRRLLVYWRVMEPSLAWLPSMRPSMGRERFSCGFPSWPCSAFQLCCQSCYPRPWGLQSSSGARVAMPRQAGLLTGPRDGRLGGPTPDRADQDAAATARSPELVDPGRMHGSF